MTEGTSIDMGDGFGGMSLLSGGAGFVGGLCRYWCDWPGFDFEKNLIKKALD